MADIESGQRLLTEHAVDCDVLIVGAGPVGLASAISLAEKKISCRLVDLNFEPVKLTKASGTHPRTLELLPRPVVKNILKESLPVVAARVYEFNADHDEANKMIMSINVPQHSSRTLD